MKYAKFVKLGGELIDADNADYPDYHGFLVCPECSEPVFLRKKFLRAGKAVRAAFVHHKGVEGFSDCELRVEMYFLEDVQRIASESRGQRLEKLKIAMWNYLETSAFIDMNQWSKIIEQVKNNQRFIDFAKDAERILHIRKGLACKRVDEFFKAFKDNPGSVIERQSQAVKDFLRQRERDWVFHSKITKEALELFVEAPQFSDIRNQLACFFCHFGFLNHNPRLRHLRADLKEWQIDFSEYIIKSLTMTFLTVDWIELLKSDTEKFNNSQFMGKGSRLCKKVIIDGKLCWQWRPYRKIRHFKRC